MSVDVAPRKIAGAVLRTLTPEVLRDLKDYPDDLHLAETLFKVEQALREAVGRPLVPRSRALVPTGDRTTGTSRPLQFLKGNRVLALYDNGRWYPARIVMRRSYGYLVEWTDGSRSRVPATDVRAVGSRRR